MDIKPITSKRFKEVDEVNEPFLFRDLHEIARKVYLHLNLQSLVRIDVRCDDDGHLHVLEANPKPDLKSPSSAVTSLTSAGLCSVGLTYDDLIMTLLADRLVTLLRHNDEYSLEFETVEQASKFTNSEKVVKSH